MNAPEVRAVPLAPTTARDATFDILKGIGILEVITHHATAHSARKYAVAGDAGWWTLMVLNRVLHFAVPVFLLASALLLARSVARRGVPDWKRFFSRRAERTLWPYLAWTVLYWFFRVRFNRIGSDIYPTAVTLGGFTWILPGLFAHPSWWLKDILWGKAYYHLYFMAVLIQFSLLFPLFYYGMRRWKPSFGRALGAALVLQGLVFVAQARLRLLPFPASTVLWYLPPVVVGMWLGLNWNGWPAAWARWRRTIFGLAVAGGSVYLTLAFMNLAGARIHGLMFNASVQAYTLGMALLLLRWAQGAAHGSGLGRFLALVGDKSLPLFLMHPAVMYLLSGPRIGGLLGRPPLPIVWVLLFTMAGTWALSWIATRTGTDVWLFGRRFEPDSYRLFRRAS